MSGEYWDAPAALRLCLLGEHARAIFELEQRDVGICSEMAKTGPEMDKVCGQAD